MNAPRVAIVHDYLIQMGGAEQVVASLHQAFPEAPVYVSVADRERLLDELRNATIVESWMRGLPGIRSRFKAYFPVYPFAFRSFGAIDADIAIVSSSGFSKWAHFAPRTQSICYCYTPPRFFWSTDDYLERETDSRLLRTVARPMLRALRGSDFNAAQRMSSFVAISECVRARIRECYQREATVIYPPVRVGDFSPTATHDGSYLVASRLVGYKRVDVAVQAFTQTGRRLIVAGDGPDRARLQRMAGPSVTFVGHVTRAALVAHMQRARALVFTGLEDFGIAPVECNASGKPVIAFAGGGALETIVRNETGVFFDAQSPESLIATLAGFERMSWDPSAARRNAERFRESRFIDEMRALVARTAA